jgi:hypothetical protein
MFRCPTVSAAIRGKSMLSKNPAFLGVMWLLLCAGAAVADECDPTTIKDLKIYTRDVRTNIVYINEMHDKTNTGAETAGEFGIPG